MATIRTGAQLFKAAAQQIQKTKQKITETVGEISSSAKSLVQRVKKTLRSFFSSFRKKKHKKADLILIHCRPKQEKKIKHAKLKKDRKSKKDRSKKTQTKAKANHSVQMKTMTQVKEQGLSEEKEKEVTPIKAAPIPAETIENFYKEWEVNWGPALTTLDKEFLESASPEVARKVIANARLTLKSPYLKAVYNGLKDLQEISDLLENDEHARQRLLPFFKEYWERKPEKFSDVLFAMHDKGFFPTRSGERRLSLDPRLVPEWLGLVG